MTSKDWLTAWESVQDREIMEHSDYKKKYGFVEVNAVYVFFQQLGILLRRRLINIDMSPFRYGQIKVTWEKIKPIIEGGRKRFNDTRIGDEFEYLYNEMRKREQTPQRLTA